MEWPRRKIQKTHFKKTFISRISIFDIIIHLTVLGITVILCYFGDSSRIILYYVRNNIKYYKEAKKNLSVPFVILQNKRRFCLYVDKQKIYILLWPAFFPHYTFHAIMYNKVFSCCYYWTYFVTIKWPGEKWRNRITS